MKINKPILLGGFAGLLLCLALFFFYTLLYLPALANTYQTDNPPQWTFIPPVMTGHMIPFTSSFLLEGLPITPLFCKATVPDCFSWGAGNTFACAEPWTMDGIAGCCNAKIMTPTTTCTDKVEQVAFAILSLILCAIYFLLGTLIAWQITKKMKK